MRRIKNLIHTGLIVCLLTSCNSHDSNTIYYKFAQMRIAEIDRWREHLGIKLDILTGEEKINIVDSLFILIDSQGNEYKCAGFATTFPPSIHDSRISLRELIQVKSAYWNIDADPQAQMFLHLVFLNMPQATSFYKLRYDNSNSIIAQPWQASNANQHWQIKIIRVEHPEVTINGVKQKITGTLEIEMEIKNEGNDSAKVFPSDFVVIDASGNQYTDPVIPLGTNVNVSITRQYKGSTSSQDDSTPVVYPLPVLKMKSFKIAPKQTKSQKYHFTISSTEGLIFRFKNLPPIKLKTSNAALKN